MSGRLLSPDGGPFPPMGRPPPPANPVLMFTYVAEDGQQYAVASGAPLPVSLARLRHFKLRLVNITPLPPHTPLDALEGVGVGRVEDMTLE